MAANEHKNLSDINRHNPKGFEVATNETVLSKGIGTSATGTDGNLVWQNKSLIGVTNYKMQGYVGSSLTNYSYGEDIADNKSPFIMDVDFGNSVISSGTLSVIQFFRIGQGCVIPETASVSSISGWIASSAGTDVTVALCKITPVENDVSVITPIAIDEITVTGLSNNSKLVRINETAITTAGLAAGDIIFIMVKDATAGSTIYINLTVQTTTY
tara:strand:- start:1155 stop:1796 length:642 start_codon:yes stop_codon:yes gene_type:complete